jgi:predicted regulator of Ras-like GTPase activity (Roadblock/LC7/MglB family)
MESSQKKLLFMAAAGILMLAIELWMFPRMFGLPLLRMSWQYFFYEFVFYGIIAVAACGARTLMSTIKAALTAFGFRMLLSAVFGVTISTLYSMDFEISLKLALLSYLPGVLLQIAMTPVICWPMLATFRDSRRRAPLPMRTEREPEIVTPFPRTPFPSTTVRERASAAESFSARPDTPQTEAPIMPMHHRTESKPVHSTGDLNGFERSVRYIAEHSSVLYAAVVDQEGLLLANFHRAKLDPEAMAPLAVMFFEWNKVVLDKGKLGPAEKIDITLRDKRLILGRVDSWCLMVFSERQPDDLLNIRITQGMDILRKFTAERYTSGQQAQMEKAYV